MDTYREILKAGDVAFAVKTNGNYFDFVEGGTSTSGRWIVNEERKFNKVIIYLENEEGATVFIGNFLDKKLTEGKYTLKFNNSVKVGTTTSSWTKFTGGKGPGYSRIFLSLDDEAVAPYPDEYSYHTEGAMITISVNAYERNPEARAACIKHYGHSCQICKMSFKDKYDGLGDTFIHVHHIVPLSEIKAEYEVDPLKDLIPVCPNCHAMLHYSKKSVRQLRALVKL